MEALLVAILQGLFEFLIEVLGKLGVDSSFTERRRRPHDGLTHTAAWRSAPAASLVA